MSRLSGNWLQAHVDHAKQQGAEEVAFMIPSSRPSVPLQTDLPPRVLPAQHSARFQQISVTTKDWDLRTDSKINTHDSGVKAVKIHKIEGKKRLLLTSVGRETDPTLYLPSQWDHRNSLISTIGLKSKKLCPYQGSWHPRCRVQRGKSTLKLRMWPWKWAVCKAVLSLGRVTPGAGSGRG